MSAALVLAFQIAATPLGPLDCTTAFAARNALAREETELLGAEMSIGQLTRAQTERLAAIRKRRRQLLVCL